MLWDRKRVPLFFAPLLAACRQEPCLFHHFGCWLGHLTHPAAILADS
jgi:hypothetical protein